MKFDLRHELAPRILRWLLDFCTMYAPLYLSIIPVTQTC